jgi:hypothetical protein
MVAVPRKQTVREVPYWLRQGCEDTSADTPETADLSEYKDDSDRSGDQGFPRFILIDNDIEGVEGGGIGAVAGENLCGDRTLQGGEAKNLSPVVPNDELDEPIAQPANAIVKKDWLRHASPRVAIGQTLCQRTFG